MYSSDTVLYAGGMETSGRNPWSHLETPSPLHPLSDGVDVLPPVTFGVVDQYVGEARSSDSDRLQGL